MEKSAYSRRTRREEYNSINSVDDSAQRDALKQLTELKLKLQETEREKSALEGSLSRTDAQMKRYKLMAEQSEKEADELQKQNRQLKKEVIFSK